MGLFDIFSKKPNKYVMPEALAKHCAKQAALTAETLQQLRALGVTPERKLRLEYFFYTDTPAKAEALGAVLSGKKYQVKCGTSASNERLQVVTGWTMAMPMDDAGVHAWIEEMCQIGFAHDCEFDGWGTTPEQERTSGGG